MTIEQALADCRAFDVQNAVVALWTFKKRHGGFSAKSIDFTPELGAELKRIVSATLLAHTEIEDYSPLAQSNEVGCLHVGTDETSFDELQALVDHPPEENRVATSRDLRNVAGYIIRLRVGTRVLYCVKRVTDSWKTKKARELVNVVFRANRLELIEDRALTISKSLDFAVLDNELFVFDKRAFEVLLNYKIEYASSFESLKQDPVFADRFVDLQPVVAHVGTNSMHLRRMAVIQQRAHFADGPYMERLRQVNAEEGWNIQFDANGRIVAAPDSMKAIMQVLLNHRLRSRLSLTTYDVPSTSAL